MSAPRIFADFQNADALGRVRLNCAGTLHDLMRSNVELREGDQLRLYSADDDTHDLEAMARVGYSAEEKCWVGIIDWNQLRRVPTPPDILPAIPPLASEPTPNINPSVK